VFETLTRMRGSASSWCRSASILQWRYIGGFMEATPETVSKLARNIASPTLFGR
jgi:hypothetical protein